MKKKIISLTCWVLGLALGTYIIGLGLAIVGWMG